MGRTKNRKKRRCGSVHKQALNVCPWLSSYVEIGKQRRRIWCGFLKWKKYVDNAYYDSFDKQDRFEEDFTVDDEGIIEYPNRRREGSRRRWMRRIKIMEEFDESTIPGRRFHSKKATRMRNVFKEEHIRLGNSFFVNKEGLREV